MIAFIIAAFFACVALVFILKSKASAKYSWDDLAAKFSSGVGTVKHYDIGRYDDEQNVACVHVVERYRNLFQCPDGETRQIKIIEALANEDDMQIIDYVRPLADPYSCVESGLVIRMQKGPWTHHAHFDAFNQHVLTLHGSKKWLLFDLDLGESKYKEELAFIHSTTGVPIDDIVEKHLKPNGIPYQIKTTHTGSALFIPRGRYHVTQNVGSDDRCIILNVHAEHADPRLLKKFQTFWPRWSDLNTENDDFRIGKDV